MDTNVNKVDSTVKSFACRDAGVNCDWRTTGNSEEEILEKVRLHAAEDHKDMSFTDELKNKIRSLIRFDKKAA